MKKFLNPIGLAIVLAFVFFANSALQAGPRHRPANPRGVADPRGVLDPRGVADPRGVLDPRGIADPRGVFDPRGRFDPRNPARYMYALPAGAAVRTFGRARFYYISGFYYYPYYINGQNVYVKATVTRGVPAVPPAPY